MTPIIQLLINQTKIKSPAEHQEYILEVIQGREEEILDVHYARKGKAVTLGSAVGNRLRFAGHPIAWVPQSFSVLSWMMYPFTQIQEEWKSEFFSMYTHRIIEWKNKDAYMNLQEGWHLEKLEQDVLVHTDIHNNQHQIHVGEHWLVHTQREWYSIRFVQPHNIPFSIIPDIDRGTYGIAAGILLSVIVTGMGYLSYQPPLETKEREIPIHLLEASLRVQEVPPPEDPIIKEKMPNILAPQTSPKGGGSKVAQSKSSGSSGPINPNAQVSSFMSGLDFGGAPLESSNVIPTIGFIAKVGSRPSGGGSFGMGLGDPWGSGGGTVDELGGLGPGGEGDGEGPGLRRSGPGTKEGRVREAIIQTQDNYTMLGGLDKSLIDEQIKKNLAQIRYCYQRELPKNPSLGGKVRIQFIIAKDGSVSKASIKSTSLNSAVVENCIVQRFLRLQFPKPEGGGIVMVNYPFIFQSR